MQADLSASGDAIYTLALSSFGGTPAVMQRNCCMVVWTHCQFDEWLCVAPHLGSSERSGSSMDPRPAGVRYILIGFFSVTSPGVPRIMKDTPFFLGAMIDPVASM